MNRFMQSAAVLPLLAYGAAAQDTCATHEVKKKLEESYGPDEHGWGGQRSAC
jgi:hypothetical protein